MAEIIVTEGLTEEEENTLCDLMEKVGSKMSYRLFRAVAKKFCLSEVETLIFRKNQGKTEILLIKRPENDPDWPGEQHSPGTVLRASDRPSAHYAEAFYRIQNEVGTPIISAKFFKSDIVRHKRGTAHAIIFICEIDNSAPYDGIFFPVDELPPNIIDHHKKMIDEVKPFLY